MPMRCRLMGAAEARAFRPPRLYHRLAAYKLLPRPRGAPMMPWPEAGRFRRRRLPPARTAVDSRDYSAARGRPAAAAIPMTLSASGRRQVAPLGTYCRH